MTNDEFAAFVRRHWSTGGGPNYSQAGDALGLDRDAVKAYCTGQTRRGNPAPVPRYVALAVLALEAGLAEGNAHRLIKAFRLLDAVEPIFTSA